MREEISALDLYYLVKEYQDLLGARVDKVYHRSDELVIQLYSTTTKKVFLFFKLPSTSLLSKKKPLVDEEASGFCLYLRKKLGVSRLKSLEQIGFERIVKIGFEKSGVTHYLVVELLPPGNFVLVDSDDKVLSMQNSTHTKDRSVRGGLIYAPLLKEYNSLLITQDALIKVFGSSDKKSVVKTLAINLGFGGVYAEEICASSGVSKDLAKPVEEDLVKIFLGIQKIRDKKIKPVLYEEGVYPFKLTSRSEEPIVLKESFSLSLGSYLGEKYVEKNKELEQKKVDSNLDKIRRILEKQEETIKKLEVEIKIKQRVGEEIYENYSKIKELLEVIRDAKKKHSYAEIKEKLKQKKLINDLDEKNKTITMKV
ncbi:hypothetical protein GOV05_02695 [Candidatus Woesearchaeota archaeon]|nr:hypothetical protein [Candidatus Woesearchaeota archaeon]